MPDKIHFIRYIRLERRYQVQLYGLNKLIVEDKSSKGSNLSTTCCSTKSHRSPSKLAQNMCSQAHTPLKPSHSMQQTIWIQTKPAAVSFNTYLSMNGDNQITNNKTNPAPQGVQPNWAETCPIHNSHSQTGGPAKCRVCPQKFHKHQKSKAVEHKSNPMPQMTSPQQVGSNG